MAKKYCNRCSHDMWYDETKKRWYCTNQKCVKYKPQPKPEPSEGNTTQTTPSTGEPAQSESKTAEPTP